MSEIKTGTARNLNPEVVVIIGIDRTRVDAVASAVIAASGRAFTTFDGHSLAGSDAEATLFGVKTYVGDRSGALTKVLWHGLAPGFVFNDAQAISKNAFARLVQGLKDGFVRDAAEGTLVSFDRALVILTVPDRAALDGFLDDVQHPAPVFVDLAEGENAASATSIAQAVVERGQLSTEAVRRARWSMSAAEMKLIGEHLRAGRCPLRQRLPNS
jgi:hypothetical protein